MCPDSMYSTATSPWTYMGICEAIERELGSNGFDNHKMDSGSLSPADSSLKLTSNGNGANGNWTISVTRLRVRRRQWCHWNDPKKIAVRCEVLIKNDFVPLYLSARIYELTWLWSYQKVVSKERYFHWITYTFDYIIDAFVVLSGTSIEQWILLGKWIS